MTDRIQKVVIGDSAPTAHLMEKTVPTRHLVTPERDVGGSVPTQHLVPPPPPVKPAPAKK